VTVTNTIVTNIVEQVPVYVTNQVVQVQPSQPDVIYVPQYNPTVVYAGYPAAYPAMFTRHITLWRARRLVSASEWLPAPSLQTIATGDMGVAGAEATIRT